MQLRVIIAPMTSTLSSKCCCYHQNVAVIINSDNFNDIGVNCQHWEIVVNFSKIGNISNIAS